MVTRVHACRSLLLTQCGMLLTATCNLPCNLRLPITTSIECSLHPSQFPNRETARVRMPYWQFIGACTLTCGPSVSSCVKMSLPLVVVRTGTSNAASIFACLRRAGFAPEWATEPQQVCHMSQVECRVSRHASDRYKPPPLLWCPAWARSAMLWPAYAPAVWKKC